MKTDQNKTFVGFGFGAIQGGLFLHEAFLSGHFKRLVVAEVVPDMVHAIRRNGGKYWVNIATKTGIRKQEISGIEIFNPAVAADRHALIAAIAEASEIGTALPSVKFYTTGKEDDVASILAAGLKRKTEIAGSPRAIIYTAENHNHAAEILAAEISRKVAHHHAILETCQALNTVIGKMSGVVTDAQQMAAQSLAPITTGMPRALLVEEFNRILITRIRWSDFDCGIRVFEEKDDLLPFEEAKLYGHNATHALIGYLLQRKGCKLMSDAAKNPDVMKIAREAFIAESGAALCKQRAGVDPLFTPEGFARYADDLLERMMNPYLQDAVERITRDPRRKLGWNDRLVGTMRIVLEQGITPTRYAMGAAAALATLQAESGGDAGELLDAIWQEDHADEKIRQQIRKLILEA
jgi:mannitol-1-phosphate 5-dehydrogenase